MSKRVEKIRLTRIKQSHYRKGGPASTRSLNTYHKQSHNFFGSEAWMVSFTIIYYL